MLTLRKATFDDIEVIWHQRRAMFFDMASVPDPVVEATADAFRHWLAVSVAAGTYHGFLAEDGAEVVGDAGLMILDWPPSPLHPGVLQRGYLLNVFVDPGYRGQGLARRLVVACQALAANLGITYLSLHASAAGRPLYEQLGWAATSEMSLRL